MFKVKMLIGSLATVVLGYFCISTEAACNTGDKDGTGVELLGTHYDCKYLRDFYPEDRHIGIYESRKYHCRMPLTDCCQTCNRILRSCEDAPVDGIYLAERYFNCSFLLKYHPEDEHVGIYKDRRSICKQTTTDCCASCEKVAQESEKSSTTVGLSSTTTTATSVQSSAEKNTLAQYKDTCVNNCLWIADGATGRCSWLLDKSRSTYKIRHSLCNGFASGCERTCHIISESEKSSTTVGLSSATTTATSVQSSAENTTPAQYKDTCENNCLWIADGATGNCSWLLDESGSTYIIRHTLCNGFASGCERTCHIISEESKSTRRSTETTTARAVCEDTFMMVEKYSYACSDLLNPNSNIYNNRQALCSSDRSSCCVTCEQVNNVKPSGVIKYTDQNMIDKGGIVIENMPSVANANGYQSDASGPTDDVKLNTNAQTKHPTPQPRVQNKFLRNYQSQYRQNL